MGVVIKYTNYLGETTERHIIPIRIYFGSTQYHQEAQWLLEAFDLDRDVVRTFALKSVLGWESKPKELVGCAKQ